MYCFPNLIRVQTADTIRAAKPALLRVIWALRVAENRNMGSRRDIPDVLQPARSLLSAEE